MIKVGMVSLGCSKNQVDAERMMAVLQQAGMELEADPAGCDAIIVNTCGFIEAAKQESIDTILEFAQLKESGALKLLVVSGCLAERYREQISESMPEVDVVLGIGSNHQIAELIAKAMGGEKLSAFGEKEALSIDGPRVLANAPYFAYLKIAEGCDNCCTYCAIPAIRGRFRSRPMESIVTEAKELAAQGVVELNVVAQDTTRYGEDFSGELLLPELLREICKIDGIRWIRLLYCYPERVTDELIDLMAREDKIVKYLDLPLQHASDKILARMNRPANSQQIQALIEKIRMRIPEIAVRTTFITGFPGETEEDFSELCEFVKQMRFERMGCFAYSQEEDTPAAEFPDQLPEEVKARRAEIIMDIQAGIAAAEGESLIGSVFEVLCEGYDSEQELYIGRTYRDAPDVDSQVNFYSEHPCNLGEFVTVEITSNEGYDLFGKAVE